MAWNSQGNPSPTEPAVNGFAPFPTFKHRQAACYTEKGSPPDRRDWFGSVRVRIVNQTRRAGTPEAL